MRYRILFLVLIFHLFVSLPALAAGCCERQDAPCSPEASGRATHDVHASTIASAYSADAGAAVRIPRPEISDDACCEEVKFQWRLQPLSGIEPRKDLIKSGSQEMNAVKCGTGLETGKDHSTCCGGEGSDQGGLEGNIRPPAADPSAKSKLGPYEQFALWLRDQLNPSLCPFVLCQRSCSQTASSCNQLNVSLLRRYMFEGVGGSGCCGDRRSN